MKKPFCDLCGNPAMEIPFTHLTFRRDILNRFGYHLTVEFTEATKPHPSTRDERCGRKFHWCPSCGNATKTTRL